MKKKKRKYIKRPYISMQNSTRLPCIQQLYCLTLTERGVTVIPVIITLGDGLQCILGFSFGALELT